MTSDFSNTSNKQSSKIICFFAHKGGVSKTTNVYHLGWMLASRFNQIVVLIDADPQCNLSHALLKDNDYHSLYENNESKILNGDIYTAIKNIHYGNKNTNQSEIMPAQCIEIKRATSSYPDCDGRLYLLPGSLKLADLEPQITFAHNVNSSDAFPALLDIAGAFRNLFVRTADFYFADYVLVDLGPSIGELNKNLFFASDYFVIPCAADAYSRSSMMTMNDILPKWAKMQKRLAEVTAEQRYPVKYNQTQFLGIIMSMFNVTGKNRIPVKHAQMWMRVVDNIVTSVLIPTLEKCGMNSVLDNENPILGYIPNFLQLMQISQNAYYPVFDVPYSDMYLIEENGELMEMSDSEKNRNLERAKPFGELYEKMAQMLIDSCN